MYCGSCLRDNALATALKRGGHEVTLIPMYTPLRTDTADASIGEVFYGGVNAWLQHSSGVFRHTPRAVDWLLDRTWLLDIAGKFGAQTSPAKLGPFVISILKGEEGSTIKELRRLVQFVKTSVSPEIVSLPNAMFIGMARMLRDELGVPVVCELTGEDIFLEAMAEPYKSEAQDLIRERAKDVNQFVATSEYYAETMSDYLQVDRNLIDVVYPGISKQHFGHRPESAGEKRPPTLGYFARICPEKGLDRLIDAFSILRKMQWMEMTRLRAAGYLGSAHKEWYRQLEERVAREGLDKAYTYVGEVDFAGKLAVLDSMDVLSVPSTWPEAKGLYVLEALARQVPVVLPRHGAFWELVQKTGGGVIVPPNDPQALAEGIAGLFADEAKRVDLGLRGQEAVRNAFTDEHMAANMVKVYQRLIR
jgi:glycosyltransferase involved in cell wall biosynthesis